jgi:hypothetical protein
MNFVHYHIKFPYICNIYDDNNMFYNNLWGFTNDPLYLVYNCRTGKPCIAYFFTFTDLYGVRFIWNFWSVTFSSGEAAWALEAHLERPEGQKNQVARPNFLVVPPMLFQSSIARFP